MGLLSNPSSKDQVSPFIIKFVSKQKFLSVFLYLGGIIWFLALANRELNGGTYFSENALLPGLVHSNYKEDALARRYLAALKTEAERYPNGMPHAFIAAQFRQLGLDTYTHNFSLHYPLGNKVFTGKNVYGILRAPRGASTECLVISAPYRPPESTYTGTNTGIAVMLSLIASFRKASYWARDIIFLVTEHEQLGMEAWLEAYHDTSIGSNIIDFGELSARAGSIQAGLNLEFPSEKASHVDIRMEGLNGQLPNLDLVNLAHRLFQQERFITTLKEREDPIDPYSTEGWVHSGISLLTFMTSHATGVPTGNHGLFHRFGIAAVTVAGSYRKGHRGQNIAGLGRALEGIIRSLNNLQERFHQSFFFYLMPATNRYISIGVYMPPFGLMIGSFLIHAVALYITRKETSNSQNWDFVNILPSLLVSLISGLVFHAAPQYLIHLNDFLELKLGTEDAVFVGFCVLSIVHVILFSYLGKRVLNTNLTSTCTHCAVLLLMSTLLFAVAMSNVSLAFLSALVIIPAFSIARPAKNRIQNAFRMGLMVLVHPILMMFMVTLVDTYRMFPEEMGSPWHFLSKAFVATQRALIYAIVDEMIYGNWLFSLATTLYLPLWSIAWSILIHSQ